MTSFMMTGEPKTGSTRGVRALMGGDARKFSYAPGKLDLPDRKHQTQCVGRTSRLLGLILLTAFGSLIALWDAGCSGVVFSSQPPPPPPSPAITTSSLPAGQMGTAYQATLSASGGTIPYSWSLASGSLPGGLSLNSASGAISGTPSASGTSSFTVQVTDSASKAAQQPLSIAISASSPVITTSSLPAGQMGAAYQATLSASGGTTPYSWSLASGSLPAGLSLNSASGVISGTPSASGTSSFTVQVTDSAGKAAQQPLSIAISASSPAITTSSLPAGQMGAAYQATLSASGGTTPYSWSLASGSLPAGLSLNSASGVISGTPSASGTSSFTVQVTDSASKAAQQPLSIAISGSSPAIMTSSLPAGQMGTAYQATLAASGGTTPYSWSLASGSLPGGLSLNSTSGVISGTPSASGTSSFTVQVMDSASKAAQQALSIAISGSSPAITTSSLPAGQMGAAYQATLSASGGTTPYSWSLASGSLPAGLSLNSASGVISGTPSASGTSSFTVQVTDSASKAAQQALSIAISGSSPAITTSSLPAGQMGAAYQATLSASGGTIPYSWSLASGSLPAGLSLNSASGAISGTPSASGTSSFTVQVMDSASKAAQQALSIAISGSSPAITTSSLPAGQMGAAYQATLSASGGTTPYSWSLASGSLPGGLSLNSTSGVISGTPSASGTSSFTVQVTDSAGKAAQQPLSIAISASSPAITTSSLPAGQMGAAYQATLSASGGTTPYSWSLASGSLPAGLSLNSAS